MSNQDDGTWMESRIVPLRQYSQYSQTGGFQPMINPYFNTNIEPQIAQRSDRRNPEVAEQKFFPSFFRNPTSLASNSHSRQYKSSLPSNAASIAGRYSNSGRSQNFDQSILGSGDFAVIRGGTFYPDNENENLRNTYRYKDSDEFFGGFFNNGHGRPKAQPLKIKKQPYYPDDPFEHFTDFADINTGNEAAFSHYKVIYANKNSTVAHSHPSPKNIFEQLQLIDIENKKEHDNGFKSELEESDDKSLIKMSKFKTKLAKTKVVKKYKKKMQGPKFKDPTTDYIDPLLALS